MSATFAPAAFTVAQLAAALNMTVRGARGMVNALEAMGLMQAVDAGPQGTVYRILASKARMMTRQQLEDLAEKVKGEGK